MEVQEQPCWEQKGHLLSTGIPNVWTNSVSSYNIQIIQNLTSLEIDFPCCAPAESQPSPPRFYEMYGLCIRKLLRAKSVQQTMAKRKHWIVFESCHLLLSERAGVIIDAMPSKLQPSLPRVCCAWSSLLMVSSQHTISYLCLRVLEPIYTDI